MFPFRLSAYNRLTSLFLFTTSSFWEWVICAPAAFLGSGRRFSGGLYRTKPWFSVLVANHGRHIMYRLKLISQTLERYVVDTKVIRSTQSYLESPTNSSGKETRRFWSNKSILILLPELSHVLAQAFPRLFHLEFMIKESYSWCNEPYAVSP